MWFLFDNYRAYNTNTYFLQMNARRKKSILRCAWLLLVATLTGCGTIAIKIPAYTPAPPAAAAAFLAGVGKVDITPPPGYPLGGHSIGGQMARGYWTRLHARAFYFQNAEGRRLVLVSCDLFAIPAGLHAQIAHDLALPPEQLIVAATHTHHGPAGYMSSAVFNFGGPLPGYDPKLAKYLSDGIVEACHRAEQDARKPGTYSVVLRSGSAPNLQRNRAIDAFFRNGDKATAAVLDASRSAGMACPDLGSENQCPRYQAADPTLHALEVLRNGIRTGLAVFYAIHNTAMSHSCTLYQSDLIGYAMHELEAGAPNGEPVVAGFFNGAEGDISPRWIAQDRRDVVNLGGKLADAVRTVLGTEAQPQPVPAISAARQVFRAVPPSGDTELLTLPGSGVGELGGAEDGRTVLYAYGWHGGVTSTGGADPRSDPKLPALDLHDIPLLQILQGILGSPKNYPQRIPVSVATLGTLSLAAIPTEMTTVQGFQLRDTLQSATGRPFVIVGLANEYIGYTATEAEYAAQDYEGASTMYGKKQGEVLGQLLSKVATAPAASPTVSVSS
jgi:neutral ceramidase